MKPRPLVILPRLKRAPYRMGWYLRWGRRLRLYRTIMGVRP